MYPVKYQFPIPPLELRLTYTPTIELYEQVAFKKLKKLAYTLSPFLIGITIPKKITLIKHTQAITGMVYAMTAHKQYFEVGFEKVGYTPFPEVPRVTFTDTDITVTSFAFLTATQYEFYNYEMQDFTAVLNGPASIIGKAFVLDSDYQYGAVLSDFIYENNILGGGINVLNKVALAYFRDLHAKHIEALDVGADMNSFISLSDTLSVYGTYIPSQLSYLWTLTNGFFFATWLTPDGEVEPILFNFNTADIINSAEIVHNDIVHFQSYNGYWFVASLSDLVGLEMDFHMGIERPEFYFETEAEIDVEFGLPIDEAEIIIFGNTETVSVSYSSDVLTLAFTKDTTEFTVTLIDYTFTPIYSGPNLTHYELIITKAYATDVSNVIYAPLLPLIPTQILETPQEIDPEFLVTYPGEYEIRFVKDGLLHFTRYDIAILSNDTTTEVLIEGIREASTEIGGVDTPVAILSTTALTAQGVVNVTPQLPETGLWSTSRVKNVTYQNSTVETTENAYSADLSFYNSIYSILQNSTEEEETIYPSATVTSLNQSSVSSLATFDTTASKDINYSFDLNGNTVFTHLGELLTAEGILNSAETVTLEGTKLADIPIRQSIYSPADVSAYLWESQSLIRIISERNYFRYAEYSISGGGSIVWIEDIIETESGYSLGGIYQDFKDNTLNYMFPQTSWAIPHAWSLSDEIVEITISLVDQDYILLGTCTVRINDTLVEALDSYVSTAHLLQASAKDLHDSEYQIWLFNEDVSKPPFIPRLAENGDYLFKPTAAVLTQYNDAVTYFAEVDALLDSRIVTNDFMSYEMLNDFFKRADYIPLQSYLMIDNTICGFGEAA